MGENKPKVEFVEIRRPPPTPSGTPKSGSCYVFRVDGGEAVVSISRRASLFGKIPPKRVQRAAQVFLEEEINRQGLRNLPQELILDAQRMDSIVKRIG